MMRIGKRKEKGKKRRPDVHFFPKQVLCNCKMWCWQTCKTMAESKGCNQYKNMCVIVSIMSNVVVNGLNINPDKTPLESPYSVWIKWVSFSFSSLLQQVFLSVLSPPLFLTDVCWGTAEAAGKAGGGKGEVSLWSLPEILLPDGRWVSESGLAATGNKTQSNAEHSKCINRKVKSFM